MRVQIDEKMEVELIDLLNAHEDVLDVRVKTESGHTLITVDASDASGVMADMKEFILDPHTHKAKSITTVEFL